MKNLRVLALALSMFAINLIGIAPAHAATFNCGTSGTYTVVAGHVTGSSSCIGRLELHSSVTAVDDQAFWEMMNFFGTGITELIIPNSVTTIGNYAFASQFFSKVVIPNSVTSIGEGAFAYMDSLRSITIANSVTTIGRDAFKQNQNVTELIIGSGASRIESDTYQEYQYISKVVVPEGVTRIDPGAFTEFLSATSFTLPSTLTNLGWASLRNMRSLRTINIPTNLSTVEDYFSYLTVPLSVPYLCSTTGSSATSAVNDYFATLIAFNTNAGRCSNAFGATTISSVTIPNSTSATINFTPSNNFGAGSENSSYSVVAFPGGNRATVSGGSARSVTINSLTPGTSYTFEVNAINNESPVITSPPSARSSAIICCTVSSTVPGAPTIGTATSLSPTSASITFTAPASNGGAVIERYTATSNPGSLTGQVTQSISGTITINGLTPSLSYTFSVTASNSVGTSSMSSATTSITMPASQEELAAAALAAQRIAVAKREAEKQSARVEISRLLADSKTPSIELFKTAEVNKISETNLPFILSELMTLSKAERENFLVIQQISKKYVILDAICSGSQFREFTASDLSEVGIIPKANKSAITHFLRLLPATERDNYSEIRVFVDEAVSEIQGRKDRFATIIAQITSHSRS